MNYRYSVIIPVYNGERTLRRCLNSLLEQNRADVQLILVSDGSTDGTDAIARSYGDRICFLRQAHAGVSAARNRGLGLAAGEYITFVDSDDWVSADYFAALDREPDCDLLIFGLGRRFLRSSPEELIRSQQLTSVCGKRIRRDFLEASGIWFREEFSVGEDFLFSYQLAAGAVGIRLSGACIYHADLSNENSLSRGYRPRLAETMETVFREAARSEKYLAGLDYLYARTALTCLAELWKVGKPEKEAICRVCGCFRDPIVPVRGMRHRFLRMALKGQWDWLLCVIAYLGKGWRFRWRRKRY